MDTLGVQDNAKVSCTASYVRRGHWSLVRAKSYLSKIRRPGDKLSKNRRHFFESEMHLSNNNTQLLPIM